MSLYRLEELFPTELQERLERQPVLILPFGTLEWHSYHLPLGLDGLVAQAIGECVARLSEGVLAPVSYWAAGGVPYPYTLNLSGKLIEPLLESLFTQFADMGFRIIVGVTGHFGLEQTLLLKRAALRVMRQSEATLLPLTEYDPITDTYTGDHAGVGETSFLWSLRPDLVRLDAVPAGVALPGVLGQDPRGAASQECGRAWFTLLTMRIAELIQRHLQYNVEQRQDYLSALQAGLDVLEATMHLRQHVPKEQVPPVTTPAYLAFCQSLWTGDYSAARQHAICKLQDLSS